jgi:hypothetical protein
VLERVDDEAKMQAHGQKPRLAALSYEAIERAGAERAMRRNEFAELRARGEAEQPAADAAPPGSDGRV